MVWRMQRIHPSGSVKHQVGDKNQHAHTDQQHSDAIVINCETVNLVKHIGN